MMLIENFFFLFTRRVTEFKGRGEKTTNDGEIRYVLKLSSGKFSLGFVWGICNFFSLFTKVTHICPLQKMYI